MLIAQPARVSVCVGERAGGVAECDAVFDEAEGDSPVGWTGHGQRSPPARGGDRISARLGVRRQALERAFVLAREARAFVRRPFLERFRSVEEESVEEGPAVQCDRSFEVARRESLAEGRDIDREQARVDADVGAGRREGIGAELRTEFMQGRAQQLPRGSEIAVWPQEGDELVARHARGRCQRESRKECESMPVNRSALKWRSVHVKRRTTKQAKLDPRHAIALWKKVDSRSEQNHSERESGR